MMDKKPEALKFIEKCLDVSKKRSCDFEENLLRYRLHYGAPNAKKDAETAPADKGWKLLS